MIAIYYLKIYLNIFLLNKYFDSFCYFYSFFLCVYVQMMDNYNCRIFKYLVINYLYFILFINFFLCIEMTNNYNSKILDIFRYFIRFLFFFLFNYYYYFFLYWEIRDNYDCRIFEGIFRDFVISYLLLSFLLVFSFLQIKMVIKRFLSY